MGTGWHFAASCTLFFVIYENFPQRAVYRQAKEPVRINLYELFAEILQILSVNLTEKNFAVIMSS